MAAAIEAIAGVAASSQQFGSADLTAAPLLSSQHQTAAMADTEWKLLSQPGVTGGRLFAE
jgi:hypothetical protein